MNKDAPMPGRDALYAQAVQAFGSAIARMARGYEIDPERARDLEQDIHVALWSGLARFRGEAALSTFVWRVAHNTGAKHVQAQMRHKRKAPLVPIEDVEVATSAPNPEQAADETLAIDRLYQLIHALKATDRQVMLLYLEDLDAAAIGAVTGLSARAVATRIHRIKHVLADRFETGEGQ